MAHNPAGVRKRGATVLSGSIGLVAGTLTCLLAAAPSAAAREDAPAPEATPGEAPPAAEPAPAQVPPSTPDHSEGGQSSSEASAAQPPPELQSSYVVRVYKIRPSKLFKGLLESLQAAGYPPEDVDESNRTVKSSFVDFKQSSFELQVAEPPPRLGGDYHVMQQIKMRVGKVSLEGIVQPGDGGAVLRMRARILVTGLDRVKRVHIFVDRRSTGVIEADFIHKLEARLGLEHL